MTLDQALQLAELLVRAARIAYQNGATVVSLLEPLQAADAAARENLETAIEELKTSLSENLE